MNIPSDPLEYDREVRRLIYDELITHASMPGAAHLAGILGQPIEEIHAAFRRMKDAHVLVLQESDREVLMAMPFSAVPTPFLVTAGEKSWWGNCIWDALGIAAMLSVDANVTTGCGDCNDAMQVRVEDGAVRVVEGTGISHFSVPARRWWDNIKFT